MAEIQSDPMVSSGEEAKVDASAAAGIECGIQAADRGQVISSDEVRKLIPQCFSKSTQNQP